jgi:hypothetical protein
VLTAGIIYRVATRIQVTFVISIRNRPCAPDCPSQASNVNMGGNGFGKGPNFFDRADGDAVGVATAREVKTT